MTNDNTFFLVFFFLTSKERYQLKEEEEENKIISIYMKTNLVENKFIKHCK